MAIWHSFSFSLLVTNTKITNSILICNCRYAESGKKKRFAFGAQLKPQQRKRTFQNCNYKINNNNNNINKFSNLIWFACIIACWIISILLFKLEIKKNEKLQFILIIAYVLVFVLFSLFEMGKQNCRFWFISHFLFVRSFIHFAVMPICVAQTKEDKWLTAKIHKDIIRMKWEGRDRDFSFVLLLAV